MWKRSMVRGFSILFLVAGIASVAQQPATQPPATQPTDAPRWTVLVDPVCPVSGFFSSNINAQNATREMRVMYFPGAKDARLKDPQSLTLHVGFTRAPRNSSTTIAFVRKDGFWEAIVPLEKFHPVYTIFFVRDDKTGAVDDNGGQLWDVVSCFPDGRKDPRGVKAQAQSYTGAAWSESLRRPTDYARAVSILETALGSNPDVTARGLKPSLWEFKARRDGGDAKAWANVAEEIGQFATSYQEDKTAVGLVSDFITRHVSVLPADFVERMIVLLDPRIDPKNSLRANVEWDRAMLEPDDHKKLAALDAFVAKYPESISLVAVTHSNRVMMLAEMGDVAGAEAALARYREARQQDRTQSPDEFRIYLTLAKLYIDRKTRLDEALKVIDEAQGTMSRNPYVIATPNGSLAREIEGQCAEMRARAYLALHKPDLAVTEARKALDLQKSVAHHFILAQALAASGEKQKALDAYFEALLLPSNNDLEYRQELENFYLKENFGNRRQFEEALERRKQAHFQASNYVPNLVDEDSPALEFSTLAGETFNAKALSGKTAIINFWSPG